jgi:hypothetical protein
MRASHLALLLSAAACLVMTVPAGAASSAASSASDSVATSVGSLSNSVQASSGSSSKTGVAQGDYRVIEVAAAPDRPGQVRLRLEPLTAGAEAFALYLPQAVAAEARLAVGDTVAARTRPYGVEFSQGEPRRAFFLALADEWLRELQTTPL